MVPSRPGAIDTARPSRARRRLPLAAALGLLLLTTLAVGCSSGDDATTLDPTSSQPGSTGAVEGASGTEPAGALTLTSSAFGDGEAIPLRHACVNQGGENASPPLAWSGVPTGTETLVLVVHDPDAALPGGFTHLVTTIPTDRSSVDDGANLSGAGPMAMWIGPCPPSGEHHYEFTLYAFGDGVTIEPAPDKAAIDAVAGQALGVAELTGLFAHQS